MKQYSLFLDEIYPGGHFDYFCLAGLIIETELYKNVVIPQLENMKREFFEGDISVILHERKINRSKGNFAVFQQEHRRKEFWEQYKVLLDQEGIYGLAVALNDKEIGTMYPGVKNTYFPALQILVENFVHFLESNNGVGTINVESTNPAPYQFDEQLAQHFHHLKANGTLFYDRRVLQTRLGAINFPLKEDNVIGLQLADMIPNTLNRELSGHKLRTYGLIDTFNNIAYDGCCDQKYRFGIKVIP